jgi:decaprenylphospho-beta-D-erythro-pentofuranosid-2-ulose 2-reductase
MEPVLILGATSDIGIALAHKFAQEKYPVQLAARNIEKLQSHRNDLIVRYNVKITTHKFDVTETNSHKEFIDSLSNFPLVVVCVVGLMGEQRYNENDQRKSSIVMRTNYEGPANILSEFANLFEQKKSGTIIGISSVAGERGRASNYFYGSAKAGFTTFLSGLRNRLFKKNVHVMTVLPGFVYTKMTQHMSLPKLLTASPKEVANSIYSAYQKKKNKIYIKNIWFYIMLIVKIIPEAIFKKTNI